MPEAVLSAGAIFLLRVCDVTLGTLRTIMVVQAKKYQAGIVGFAEVLIWIFAMKYIVQHMDSSINLISYAAGFGIGAVVGISIEQKIGMGYIQVNMISKTKSDLIAKALRDSNHGVTILPGSGVEGDVNIVYSIIKKRKYGKLKDLVVAIDPEAFINIQQASPTMGYIHGGRK